MGADLYAILGVSRNATAEEIKLRYRERTRTEHPDVVGHRTQDAATITAADRRWKTISAAYTILKDPEKRANYDFECAWERELARQAVVDAAPPPPPPPGKDVRATLRVPLLTAIRGGKVPHGVYIVSVPRGALSGMELRLPGKGEPGFPSGDLILTIQVETHPDIMRITQDEHGRKLPAPNLWMECPISWREAYCGGLVTIPTPWEDFKLDVVPEDDEKNIYDGLTINLSGFGGRCSCTVPCHCPRGDLIVRLKLIPPEPGDVEMRRVLTRLQPTHPRGGLVQAMKEAG